MDFLHQILMKYHYSMPGKGIGMDIFYLNGLVLTVIGLVAAVCPALFTMVKISMTKRGYSYIRQWGISYLCLGIISLLIVDVQDDEVAKKVFALGLLGFHQVMMILSIPWPWTVDGFFDWMRYFFFCCFHAYLAAQFYLYHDQHPGAFKIAENTLYAMIYEIQHIFT